MFVKNLIYLVTQSLSLSKLQICYSIFLEKIMCNIKNV